MRILIWSPNYAPEQIGIPPLVTDAAEWLAKRDHVVSVVTAMPNYPQRRIYPAYQGRMVATQISNGVEVRRSWIRVRPGESFVDKAIYEASFAVFSAPGLISRLRKADLVVSLVPTLLSSATAAALARITDTKLALWVQDLVLNAATAVAGLSPAQARILKEMKRVESYALSRADVVVTCSPGFVPYLEDLGALPSSVMTIPNWVDITRIAPSSPARGEGPPTFLYTGNIGYTQGFETLIDAAKALGDVRLRIVGAGNAEAQVNDMLTGTGAVEPPVPIHEYGALLASATALVVVQRKVAANANLPSKIASYLSAGRPIVASIGLDTPAAEILRESRAAVVVEPERSDLLAAAMRRLADDSQLRQELGTQGRRYAETHLAKDVVLERLERAFLGA